MAGARVARKPDQIARRPARDIEATVILPAYNEARALPRVLASLLAVLDERSEIIVVDDGSTDSTATVASRYPCRLVRHKRNRGKGAAVRTGIKHARGGFIVVMDADNTYPADAVPRMIALSEDYDLVRCAREGRALSMPLLNRLGNHLFDFVLKIVNGLDGDDHLSGLYGLRREALEIMDFTSDGFDMEVEIGIKARAHRLRCASFPIPYAERIGEKKLRVWRDGWRILGRILSLTVLYNPGAAFVLPGLLLWAVAAMLAFGLSQGPVRTPHMGLSVNSLIVAAIGASAGFQLVVFGVAAAFYAAERGLAPGPWFALVRSPSVRRALVGMGMLGFVIGVLTLLGAIGRWLVAGGGPFHETPGIVLGGMLLTWGMQAALAALFISIFANRLESAARRRGQGLAGEVAELHVAEAAPAKAGDARVFGAGTMVG